MHKECIQVRMKLRVMATSKMTPNGSNSFLLLSGGKAAGLMESLLTNEPTSGLMREQRLGQVGQLLLKLKIRPRMVVYL